MSRIGKLPIEIPAGVQVNIGEDNTITVKGPLGTLTQQVDKAIKVTREDNSLHFVRPDDEKGNRSMPAFTVAG